jgi:hypothetical protein
MPSFHYFTVYMKLIFSFIFLQSCNKTPLSPEVTKHRCGQFIPPQKNETERNNLLKRLKIWRVMKLKLGEEKKISTQMLLLFTEQMNNNVNTRPGLKNKTSFWQLSLTKIDNSHKRMIFHNYFTWHRVISENIK